MSDKKKFSNLSRGSDKLSNALSSFIVDEGEKADDNSFNPLKDDKRKLQKKAKENEKKDDVQTKDKPLSNKTGKSQDQVSDPVKKKTPGPSHDHLKDAKTKDSVKRSARAETVKTVPDDFKAHSALFSRSQLDLLRKTVNYKKWKVNPKYTISSAIYEALDHFFLYRRPANNFPDDFITYTASFSESQMEDLRSYIGEIKFKEDPGYAIKYALYEAIQSYLKKNPIKE